LIFGGAEEGVRALPPDGDPAGKVEVGPGL
jgi:hypothetical protein